MFMIKASGSHSVEHFFFVFAQPSTAILELIKKLFIEAEARLFEQPRHTLIM